MALLEDNIQRINQKLQQLLKQHQQLQKENERQIAQLGAFQLEKLQHLQTIEHLQTQVSILKTSTGSMNEQEKKSFEKQIGSYLKEIDKCIALLSE